MLRYLTEQGIGIGAELELVERQPFDGPCLVRLRDQQDRSLGIRLAQAIHVERPVSSSATRSGWLITNRWVSHCGDDARSRRRIPPFRFGAQRKHGADSVDLNDLRAREPGRDDVVPGG